MRDLGEYITGEKYVGVIWHACSKPEDSPRPRKSVSKPPGHKKCNNDLVELSLVVLYIPWSVRKVRYVSYII